MFQRRTWLFAVLALLLLTACGDHDKVKLQRADMPEAPPPAFANLPPPTGYTVKRFGSQPAMDAYCRANGVSANDVYNPRMFMGCTVPREHVIALLNAGMLHDAPLETAIEHHEITHAYGLVHDAKGHGWYVVMPNGQLHAANSPADTLYARAMPAPMTGQYGATQPDPHQALQALAPPGTPTPSGW